MNYPAPGDLIGGKYRITEVIGEGGFGIVYRASTEGTGRAVAIKLQKVRTGARGRTADARFQREMRVVAQLEAAETLTLYDYGQTADGRPFMVTEFVEGEDLADLIARRGSLSEGETLHVLLQVLYSLREAHEAGVLHRDIKPRNIRVYEHQGDPLRVKVLDFGIAKLLDGAAPKVTVTGNIVGTPKYMAPELFLGDALTPRHDIFAAGIVAVEMLMGSDAIAAAGLNPVARRIRLTPADPVSREVRDVINRMVAADPEERFASVGEIIALVRPMRRAYKRLDVVPRPPAEVRDATGLQGSPESSVSSARPARAGLDRRLPAAAATTFFVVALGAVMWGKQNASNDEMRVTPVAASSDSLRVALKANDYELGVDAMHEGDLLQALAHFRKVDDADGADVEHLRSSGFVDTVFRRLARDESALRSALQIYPERVALFTEIGSERVAEGVPAQARRWAGDWHLRRTPVAVWGKDGHSPREVGAVLRRSWRLDRCDDGEVSRMVVEVMVLPSGLVDSVEVVDGDAKSAAGRCVARVLLATKFGPTVKSAYITGTTLRPGEVAPRRKTTQESLVDGGGKVSQEDVAKMLRPPPQPAPRQLVPAGTMVWRVVLWE